MAYPWTVLPRVGTSSATLWVRNPGVDGSDAEKIEGVHVGFLRKVKGVKDRRLGDETWKKEEVYRVLQAEGTKPIWEYINKRQAMVAGWVALWPIFEVCAKDMGYEGGGKLCETWWQQAAV